MQTTIISYPRTVVIMLKSSYGGIFGKEFTFSSEGHERNVRRKLIGKLA